MGWRCWCQLSWIREVVSLAWICSRNIPFGTGSNGDPSIARFSRLDETKETKEKFLQSKHITEQPAGSVHQIWEWAHFRWSKYPSNVLLSLCFLFRLYISLSDIKQGGKRFYKPASRLRAESGWEDLNCWPCVYCYSLLCLECSGSSHLVHVCSLLIVYRFRRCYMVATPEPTWLCCASRLLHKIRTLPHFPCSEYYLAKLLRRRLAIKAD